MNPRYDFDKQTCTAFLHAVRNHVCSRSTLSAYCQGVGYSLLFSPSERECKRKLFSPPLRHHACRFFESMALPPRATNLRRDSKWQQRWWESVSANMHTDLLTRLHKAGTDHRVEKHLKRVGLARLGSNIEGIFRVPKQCSGRRLDRIPYARHDQNTWTVEDNSVPHTGLPDKNWPQICRAG